MKTLQPGSISHGTLRPQDLLPAFLAAIHSVEPDIQDIIFDDDRFPHDDSAWWDSEDCAWRLETVQDALNEYVPEGYYFGTMEGDASDFGVWAVQEQDWLD